MDGNIAFNVYFFQQSIIHDYLPWAIGFIMSHKLKVTYLILVETEYVS